MMRLFSDVADNLNIGQPAREFDKKWQRLCKLTSIINLNITIPAWGKAELSRAEERRGEKKVM